MSDLALRAVNGGAGLYVGPSASGVTLYYQSLSGASQGDAPDAAALWSTDEGCWCFAPSAIAISDPGTLQQRLTTALGAGQAGARWIAWISDPNATADGMASWLGTQEPFPHLIPILKSSNFQVTAQVAVPFGNITLELGPQSTVAYDAATSSFAVTSSGRTQLDLRGTIQTLDIGDTVTIALTGDDIGTLASTLTVQQGDLYALFDTASSFAASPGPEFLYTYGTPATVLRYPFLMGANSQSGSNVALIPRFDPLNPRDATRTCLALDVGSTPPTSDFFFTPVGNALSLRPVTGSGFALGGRYDDTGSVTGDFVAYLTPGGPYAIGAPTTTPKAVQVMCGLWGTEFLLVAENDMLEFVSSGAASADRYDPGGGSGVDTALTVPFDTTYVHLIPSGGASPFTGDIRQSYCVLAVSSVYYDCATNTPFPIAIGCRMADLSDPSTTEPFPMVPYGAVYAADVNGDVVDGEIASTVLMSYETDVIAPARRAKMPGDDVLGPIFFSLDDYAPLHGGRVHTGNGLVVDLNDGSETPPHPGTWKSLSLAKSPVDGALLQFNASDVADDPTAPKVVSPYLANALLQGAPFLVIGAAGCVKMDSGRTPLGGFANEIQLGEFTFKVDVGDQPPAPNSNDPVGGAIIIFKYATQVSVLDLYAQAVKWTAAETFVGDAAATAALQSRIRDNFVTSGLIDAGTGDPTSPASWDVLFADFNTKMSSTDWTGMIVLDCPLDYSQFPIDLQILLGGIKQGVLTAHHFGVTSNQLQPATSPNPCEIDQSSLFGLVHHEETALEPTNDPDFQLLELNALFVNSALTHFDSRIAVSAKKLFGDPTSLQQAAQAPNDKPEWNTVAIDGTYQKRGASGVVVYGTDTPRRFTYSAERLRALDTMVASTITLTPTSRVPDAPAPGDEVRVNATIGFAGQLGFREDITDGDDFDLFSFEVPSDTVRGLEYSLYNLDMTTVIPATSANKRPYLDYPLTTDLSATVLDASDADTRDDSLVQTFPLKLVGLRYDAAGMTAASIGGKSITVQTDKGNVTAANPVYALVLQMVMGTAGALQSDKTPLEGSLLVGWTAGGDDDTDDGFGVLFEPPAAMGRGSSLALEGVLNTVFGGLTLKKLEVGECGNRSSSEQFVLTIADVVFWILGLPFGAARRELTMFGDPKTVGTDQTRLAWFMGVSGQGDSPTDLSSAFSFTPVLGFTSGLKVNTDLTSTTPLSNALSQLTTVTNLSMTQVFQSICSGQEIGETTVTYDPSAGLLFFLELNVTPLGLTVEALFADPTFYGGRISFGAAPEGTNLAPFFKALSGLAVEFDYRKISDGLGVYSFEVEFTRRYQNSEGGGGNGGEDEKKVPLIQLGEAQIVLPSVGVNIWTNGDWMVAVGWPFSSTKTFVNGQPLKIYFQAGPFPLELMAGFYAANLHPQDVPAVFGGCPLGLIRMGGAGLSFGVGKAMEWGPVEAMVELYGTIIVSAMTASIVPKDGSATGAPDYWWFDVTIGITLHAEAALNLAIIKASLDLEAAIEVAVAAEYRHATQLVVEAGLKIDLAVKIIFFTIHITFTIHVTIYDNSFGSGPVAETEGPTPKAISGFCTGENGAASAGPAQPAALPIGSEA